MKRIVITLKSKRHNVTSIAQNSVKNHAEMKRS
jgi:hypothetical protein